MPEVTARETLQLRSTGISLKRPLSAEAIQGPLKGARFGPLTLPLNIGAAPGNDVVLDDPAVSRHHCTIEERSEGVLIRDTGSTNGVWLAGHQVLLGLIKDGTTVTLGQTVLRFQFGEARPETSSPESHFGPLSARSPAMQNTLRTLARVAATKVSILMEGEPGTGARRIATAVHAQKNDTSPFVVVDVGTTPAAGLEALLLGNGPELRGALAEAQGGTLFLDEVGDLPFDLQPKFLRALEGERNGTAGTAPDVRLIAATRHNLRRMVNEGTFREDLYLRLAVCPIRLPALRERREDIRDIAQEMYRRALELVEESAQASELDRATVAWLERQPWPGNLRELENMMQRAVILADEHDIQAGHLASALERAVQERNGAPTVRVSLEDAKRTFERHYLLELLHRHEGNRTAAATEADIHVKSLQRLVRRHGLKGEIP